MRGYLGVGWEQATVRDKEEGTFKKRMTESRTQLFLSASQTAGWRRAAGGPAGLRQQLPGVSEALTSSLRAPACTEGVWTG